MFLLYVCWFCGNNSLLLFMPELCATDVNLKTSLKASGKINSHIWPRRAMLQSGCKGSFTFAPGYRKCTKSELHRRILLIIGGQLKVCRVVNMVLLATLNCLLRLFFCHPSHFLYHHVYIDKASYH